MSVTSCSEPFVKGMKALRNEHFYLARVCFEQAVGEARTAPHCSFLALSLARTRTELQEAISLAIEAVENDPDNSVCYLNLGRVYLAAKERYKAIETFRKGLQCEINEEIVDELEQLGTRKSLPFPSLDRSHPLNKFAGKFLKRLQLR